MARKTDIVGFDYKDVMLLPEQCQVGSRSEVDVSSVFGPKTFKIPVVPANMSSVIGTKLAKTLASNGYFYIQHRFNVDPIIFSMKMHEANLFSSVSFGVQKIDFENVQRLEDLDSPVEYLTIDIAHGDTKVVYDLIKEVKKVSPDTFVIAGNVANGEAVQRLEEAGADAAKVGIAPGCFHGDMKVLTSEGPKEIKNISLGDNVLTHTGNFKEVVNKFVYNHHKEFITINGIECTLDHKFYVCNKSDIEKINEENYQDFCYWVEAKNLDQKTQSLINLEN